MVSHNAIIAAFSSTALISIAPNVLLFLFPKYGSGEGEHSAFLSLGQAIAAGGLLGDVFLHVIPHSLSGHGGSAAMMEKSSCCWFVDFIRFFDLFISGHALKIYGRTSTSSS